MWKGGGGGVGMSVAVCCVAVCVWRGGGGGVTWCMEGVDVGAEGMRV